MVPNRKQSADDEDPQRQAAPSAPSTFAQMQLAGMARPAPPPPTPDPMLSGALAAPLYPGAVPLTPGQAPPPLPSAPVVQPGVVARPAADTQAPTPQQPAGPPTANAAQINHHVAATDEAPPSTGGPTGQTRGGLAAGLGGPLMPKVIGANGEGGQPTTGGSTGGATGSTGGATGTPRPTGGTVGVGGTGGTLTGGGTTDVGHDTPVQGGDGTAQPTTTGDGLDHNNLPSTETHGGGISTVTHDNPTTGGSTTVTHPQVGVAASAPGYSYTPKTAASYADPKIKEALLAGLNGGSYVNPNADAQQKMVSDWLANPSAYDSKLLQDNFKTLGAGLDESYGLDRKAIDDQMARRGLFDSTEAVGRLGDSQIQHDRAKSTLAQNLLTDQAHTLSADRSAASGAANAEATTGANIFNTNENARQGRINQAMNYDDDIYKRSYDDNRAAADDDYRMQQLYMQMMGYSG